MQLISLQAQDAGCMPLQPAVRTVCPTTEAVPTLRRSSASFKAANALPTRPGSSLAPTSGCSSNVLYAIIALLGDLDDSALHIVKAEVTDCELFWTKVTMLQVYI